MGIHWCETMSVWSWMWVIPEQSFEQIPSQVSNKARSMREDDGSIQHWNPANAAKQHNTRHVILILSSCFLLFILHYVYSTHSKNIVILQSTSVDWNRKCVPTCTCKRTRTGTHKSGSKSWSGVFFLLPDLHVESVVWTFALGTHDPCFLHLLHLDYRTHLHHDHTSP